MTRIEQGTCPRLDDAHAFADDLLPRETRDAFRLHLRGCEECRTAITDAWAVRALCRRACRRREERDHARELLEVAIGLGGLAWWAIDEAAWWAFRRALWAVLPAPVREYMRWQGASARVTWRWE